MTNRGRSLPLAESGPPFVEERIRTVSDPHKVLQVPEPFESIPAQELLRDNCRHCGWIRKEGGNIKTWNDRYAIIHRGCLYYYYKPESTSTAGKFSLSGYRLSPAPEKSSKYQWTFKLVNVQPEKRTFYFAAYSEQEMNEWMQKLSDDIEEYCGVAAQITSPSNNKQAEDHPDYSYPEVEPQFDPNDLPAVLRQLLSPASPRESDQATTDEMYCPPPDQIDTSFRPQQRQLPPIPAPRKDPIGPGVPKFSYTGDPGIGGAAHQRLPPASGNFSSLRPSLPPRRSPSPSREAPTPHVPLRPRKPGPGLPLPVTPPMRSKPEPNLRKHLTAPNLKLPVENVESQVTGRMAEEDEGEDYLAIVPDTDPRDFQEQGKKSTLQRRGDPDGKSFRRPRIDDVLPPSAVRLDLDKTQVAPLLKRKRGVYIMRESQSTQSKRALSVWTGEKVSHYLIFYDQGQGYALEPEKGPRFNSIENLVRHYFECNLPNTEVKLTMPYK